MDDFRGAPSADARAMMAYDAGKKSGVVAYLLWFLVGTFGAHRFYFGQTGPAVAQLLMNIIGWFLAILVVGFFLLIPLWIWVFVDAFLIPGWLKQHNLRLASALGASAGT